MGHQVVLEELLQKGSDPGKPSQNQMAVYPINSAAAHRNAEIALELVRKLVEYGAEVNAAQHGGWTALHQAALHGDQALVTLLLDSGADGNLNSKDGRTASQVALENGYDQLAEKIAS
jgi:ankyrin repeat protein